MFNRDLLTYLEGFITPQRQQRFQDILKQRTKYLTVAIEDVYQLHNTSAVIRSCDAFGIQEAHVIEDRFGKRLDKNIAMGAERWVDVHRYKNTSDCIRELKSQGYQIIATTPHIKSSVLDDFKIHGPTALFFGTEKEGLSSNVLENADGYLSIPMQGFSESLNISVAAAISLRYLSNQLRNSSIDWQLTETEILEKRMDWTKKSIKDVERIIGRYHAN